MTHSADYDVVRRVIARRTSVRRFDGQPIPAETLRELVEAGIQAPSGSNWQNQRFLVIDDPAEIRRIGSVRFVWPYRNADLQQVRKRHPAGIIGEAVALIVVFADSARNDRRGNGEYRIWESLEIQNCAASIENILILATALRLGSCWVSASDAMSYTRLLSRQSWRGMLANYDIPLTYKLQGIVMLGHPRKTDDEGFPAGEKNHGATIWQATERRPIDHYLIRARPAEPETRHPLRWHVRVQLALCSAMIRAAHAIATRCDRYIHKHESVVCRLESPTPEE